MDKLTLMVVAANDPSTVLVRKLELRTLMYRVQFCHAHCLHMASTHANVSIAQWKVHEGKKKLRLFALCRECHEPIAEPCRPNGRGVYVQIG